MKKNLESLIFNHDGFYEHYNNMLEIWNSVSDN